MCVCFCVLGITAYTLFNMFQTDRKGEKKKQTHRNKERGSKKVKEGYSYLKDRSKEIEERDRGVRERWICHLTLSGEMA